MDCTNFEVDFYDGAFPTLFVTCTECDNWEHRFDEPPAHRPTLAQINDITQEHAREYHG
jgi:hypothetical protein